MTLLDAQPDRVLRLGAAFGMFSDQARAAVGSAQAASVVSWVGPPSEAYQSQLRDLVGRLRQVQRVYDEACDALLSYARALASARELAVQASQLPLASALEDIASGKPLGMDPMTADRMVRLNEAATSAHDAAALRCAAVLDALARQAPPAPHAGFEHAIRNITLPFVGAVESVPGLAKDLFGAVTGDRGSQHDLAGDAKQALNVLGGLEDLIHDLRSHEYSIAGGQAGTLIMLRGKGFTLERFGELGRLPASVLEAAVRGGVAGDTREAIDAWVREHGQREFLERYLEHVGKAGLTVEQLLTQPVDLFLHEALGGHALRKHIGRDLQFLIQRQRREPGSDGGIVRKSTFVSLDEAEREVTAALRSIPYDEATWQQLVSWLQTSERFVVFKIPLTHNIGLLIDRAERIQRATKIVIRLGKRGDGTLYIDSTWVT